MKKFLSLFMAIIMAGTMGATAFAATTSSGSKLDQRIETLTQRQQKISDAKAANEAKQAELTAKKATFDAFKQALAEKKLSVLSNRDANLSVTADTNRLRLSLAQSLDALKKSGASLPEETAAQLKDCNAQMKELVSALKDTKGQIKAITAQNKGFVKNKDYAAMDAAYAQITAIQTGRHDQLVKINELLQKMNTLVTPADTDTGTPSSAT